MERIFSAIHEASLDFVRKGKKLDWATHDFTHDCSQCRGLCCIWLKFKRGPDFAFTKPVGVRCRHLSEDFMCQIHSQLAERGMDGCNKWSCHGAGNFIVANVAESEWSRNYELAKAMGSDLLNMSRLFASMGAIKTGRLVVQGKDAADVLRKVGRLIESRLPFTSVWWKHQWDTLLGKFRALLLNERWQSISPFEYDCETCAALCCFAREHSTAEGCHFDKPQGERCRHLTENNRCGVWGQLDDLGLADCRVFSCHGAAPYLSRLYEGRDWRASPEERQVFYERLLTLSIIFSHAETLCASLSHLGVNPEPLLYSLKQKVARPEQIPTGNDREAYTGIMQELNEDLKNYVAKLNQTSS